ncbi:MAG: hypothetical protein HY231_03920 [Acidobacteria bacterium]|nr:hypothetical protein [Acidobacteriota bacterium]
MAEEDSTHNLPEDYKTSPVLELILERVTAIGDEVAGLRESQTQLREEMITKIDGLREEMNTKIDGLHEEVNTKMDGLREEVNTKMDGLREEMKVGFKTLNRRMEVLSIDMIELRGQQREVIEVIEKFTGQPT